MENSREKEVSLSILPLLDDLLHPTAEKRIVDPLVERLKIARGQVAALPEITKSKCSIERELKVMKSRLKRLREAESAIEEHRGGAGSTLVSAVSRKTPPSLED
mmetsp:Transcript_24563/g.49033  ORF Transcript_24563/g.49033 Transcript_24563/m.49033 type:complete len:104 (+) Transcript_24563:272-583(+)